MNGRTGIGKGLFTESIIFNLVGKENAVIAPASWDKSSFNAWMLNKQFILMDEVKVQVHGHESNINYLKRINNDVQNIEKKGIDADKVSQNYASFFITSNNGTKNFKLEEDNRRFAPVDLTKDKFVNKYTEEEQKKILQYVKDEDVIAQLYWYIQQNHNPNKTNPKRTPLSILQCPTYFDFKYESLSMWQKVIVDEILTKDRASYSRSYLKQQYKTFSKEVTATEKRFTATKQQIENFLFDYRHRGDKTPMGTVEFDTEGEMVVLPAKRYISKKAKEHADYNFHAL